MASQQRVRFGMIDGSVIITFDWYASAGASICYISIGIDDIVTVERRFSQADAAAMTREFIGRPGWERID